MYGRVLKGNAKASLNRGLKGLACHTLLKFEDHPRRDVAGSRGVYATVWKHATSSCSDIGVVLQFQEYFEAAETSRIFLCGLESRLGSCTFRPSSANGRGFTNVLGRRGRD